MSYAVYCIYILVFGLLFFQFYIRFKVVKAYQKLNKLGVQLRFKDVFDKKQIQSIAESHNKSVQDEIYQFTRNIRRTFSVSMIIVILLLIFGFVLLNLPITAK